MRNKLLHLTHPERALGFNTLFDELFRFDSDIQSRDYPPYNIIKIDDNTHDVEMAVAGYKKDDLKIEIDNNVLSISGQVSSDISNESYSYRGISRKKFTQSFKLMSNTEVDTPTLEDGILKIRLTTPLPEKTSKVLEIK